MCQHDPSDICHPPSAMSHYLDLLLEANARFNLTAVRERDTAWQRLILDSLTLQEALAQLPPGSRVIDVGTGGGIPGVPLAINLPGMQFTLLDATGKKVRFLEQAIATLSLPNVQAIQDRAETLGRNGQHRQHYDAAVSRAVGTVSEVLEYTLPLVKVGGQVLLLKGAEAQEQLAAAGDALDVLGAGDVAVFDAYPQGTGDRDLVIISVLKDRPTPAAYPRRPGVPKGQPL